MSDATPTVPAPYSKDEREFQQELRQFFGRTWCPPDRLPTRQMPAVRLEKLKNKCR